MEEGEENGYQICVVCCSSNQPFIKVDPDNPEDEQSKILKSFCGKVLSRPPPKLEDGLSICVPCLAVLSSVVEAKKKVEENEEQVYRLQITLLNKLKDAQEELLVLEEQLNSVKTFVQDSQGKTLKPREKIKESLRERGRVTRLATNEASKVNPEVIAFRNSIIKVSRDLTTFQIGTRQKFFNKGSAPNSTLAGPSNLEPDVGNKRRWEGVESTSGGFDESLIVNSLHGEEYKGILERLNESADDVNSIPDQIKVESYLSEGELETNHLEPQSFNGDAPADSVDVMGIVTAKARARKTKKKKPSYQDPDFNSDSDSSLADGKKKKSAPYSLKRNLAVEEDPDSYSSGSGSESDSDFDPEAETRIQKKPKPVCIKESDKEIINHLQNKLKCFNINFNPIEKVEFTEEMSEFKKFYIRSLVNVNHGSLGKLGIIHRFQKETKNLDKNSPEYLLKLAEMENKFLYFEYEPSSGLVHMIGNFVNMDEASKSIGCAQCKYQCSFEWPVSATSAGGKPVKFQLKKHIQQRHLYIYQCAVAGCDDKTLYNYINYPLHLKCHMGACPVKECEICGRPFYKKESLKFHLWSHKNAEEKAAARKAEPPPSFPCSVCGKEFSSLNYLSSHEEIHSEQREKVMCPDCGKLVFKAQFYAHKKETCRIANVKCIFCDKLFKTRRNMEKHTERIHRNVGQRNYSCEICSSTFTTKLYLQAHLVSVHGEKKFNCKKGCGKKFSKSSNCKRHEATCKFS